LNKYLTYCARAKLLNLFKGSRAIAIRLVSPPQGPLGVEFAFSSDGKHDIMISISPPVITDRNTLRLLKDHSIDFDYQTSDFIIS
jgi:hypothetical protein